MAILRGQAAIDYAKANPGKLKVISGTLPEGLVARKSLEEMDQGSFLQRGILGAITRPFRTIPELWRVNISNVKDDVGYSDVGYKPKFLSEREYADFKGDPYLSMAKAGAGVASFGVGGGASSLGGAVGRGALGGGLGGFGASEKGKEVEGALGGAVFGGALGGGLFGAGKLAGKVKTGGLKPKWWNEKTGYDQIRKALGVKYPTKDPRAYKTIDKAIKTYVDTGKQFNTKLASQGLKPVRLDSVEGFSSMYDDLYNTVGSAAENVAPITDDVANGLYNNIVKSTSGVFDDLSKGPAETSLSNIRRMLETATMESQKAGNAKAILNLKNSLRQGSQTLGGSIAKSPKAQVFDIAETQIDDWLKTQSPILKDSLNRMSAMKTITPDFLKNANEGEFFKTLGMGSLKVPTGGIVGKTRMNIGQKMVGKGGQGGLASVANVADDITPEGIAAAASGQVKATPIKILSNTHKSGPYKDILNEIETISGTGIGKGGAQTYGLNGLARLVDLKAQLPARQSPQAIAAIGSYTDDLTGLAKVAQQGPSITPAAIKPQGLLGRFGAKMGIEPQSFRNFARGAVPALGGMAVGSQMGQAPMESGMGGGMGQGSFDGGMLQQQPSMASPSSGLIYALLNSGAVDLSNLSISDVQKLAEMLQPTSGGGGGGLNVSKVTPAQYNMAISGVQSLNEALGLLFDEDGGVNQLTIAGQVVPKLIRSQKSKQLKSALFNASEILLRLRSGAAVPEQEVKRFVDGLGIMPTDSRETIFKKLQPLMIEYQGLIELANPGVTSQTDPYSVMY